MRIQITTPPNTPTTNPLITRLPYGRNELKRVSLRVPKGHAFLTGIRLIAGNQKLVIPDTSSNVEWITDDDRIIIFNVNVVFDAPSFDLEIKTYNEDDTYEHSHYLDLE